MQRHTRLICSIYNHSVFDHQSCHKLLIAFFLLLFFCSFFLYFPTASKTLQPSSLPFWTVVMEGVLLYSCYQQPKLRPHGRKPHLCPGGPLRHSVQKMKFSLNSKEVHEQKIKTKKSLSGIFQITITKETSPT